MDKYSIQQVTKSLKIAMEELCIVKLHVIGPSSVQAWTFSGFSVTAKVSFRVLFNCPQPTKNFCNFISFQFHNFPFIVVTVTREIIL